MMANKANIMIVDDDSTNLMVLGRLLRDNGYSVEAATSGFMALELIDEYSPDLILLDVMMPEMDGYETCRRIKAKLDSVPVLFISALDQIDDMVKGLNSGAIDYLLKPFNPKLLLSKISVYIDLKTKTEMIEKLNRTLEEKVKERTLELEKANGELSRLDEAKSDFLRIISHEIRTPLNGILGFTSLIKTEGNDVGIRRFIDLLEASVKRLEVFSINALRYTELRTGKYQLLIKEEELNLFISDIVQTLQQKIADNCIEVSIDVPKELTLEFDQALMFDCLYYIMDNAIKYGGEGSLVKIIASQSNHETFLQVIDQGAGFSEKALSNLFKLFVPGDTFVNQNEGIELAICKLIMDLHHGQISVTNIEKGASVNLIFNNKLA
jgi:two-component system sensor histidine kinase/response regulator